MKGWKRVGVVGVDAGLIWVGDPCYILGNERPENVGKDWKGFLDKLKSFKSNHDNGVYPFNYDLGHAGLGVCVDTAYGDGSYGVYVKYNEEGRVAGVMVDFDDIMEDDGQD